MYYFSTNKLKQKAMKTITKNRLEDLSIDALATVFDEANFGKYTNASFNKIDAECKNRVKTYNADFGTEFTNFYQVDEHYNSIDITMILHRYF